MRWSPLINNVQGEEVYVMYSVYFKMYGRWGGVGRGPGLPNWAKTAREASQAARKEPIWDSNTHKTGYSLHTRQANICIQDMLKSAHTTQEIYTQ